jgi:glycosyltransferase involved in cell wall biosynthesis
MRICILANALSVHTRRWAVAFAERGHEVHVLSIRWQEIPGVQVHCVRVGPRNSGSAAWTFLSYLRLLLSAGRRLRRLKPDVVNACFVPTHGVIAAFAGCGPLALSVWGSDVVAGTPSGKPWILRVLVRYAMRRADVVCATSGFLVEQARWFCPPGKLIRRTPFGVDTAQFHPAEPAEPDGPQRAGAPSFRIGFVKTLHSKYGPDVLLRAMPAILRDRPDARLVMAGRGPMRARLEALAAELGVAQAVEFPGFLPHEDLPPLLRSLDVFVNPSVCQEAFGVSILEASACGVPVVATRVGGVPEVCMDGQTGILVEPNDPQALAGAILGLAEDPQQRLRLGRRGSQFVGGRYAWGDCVTTMLECLIGASGSKAQQGRPAEDGGRPR